MSSTGSSKTGSRRRRRSAGGVLWLLAVLNTVAGMIFSTATAPKVVSIQGADPADFEKMKASAQTLVSTPWMRVGKDTGSTLFTVNSAMDSVSYGGNVFGRSYVAVQYRKPLLALDGSANTYVDPSGTVFVRNLSEGEDAGLPRLKLPSLPTPNAGLVGQYDAAVFAEIAKLVGQGASQLDYSLEVDSEFVISLRVKEGARFVLGSSDKLVEKVKVLAAILADGKQKLKASTTVNLAAPDRPTVSE